MYLISLRATSREREEERDLPRSSSNELQVCGPSSGVPLSIVFTSIDIQKINNLSLTSEAPRFFVIGTNLLGVTTGK